MTREPNFTPREVVSELDTYIIGQNKAKRAVASALRSRWRRQRVDETLRHEISPKNIIMIGPTGVGKTEIARRLAKLARAPFLKVEASKFTEVGYVGRDVESIIRDLVELGMRMVRDEGIEAVAVRAAELAEARLIRAIAADKLHGNQPRESSTKTHTQPSVQSTPFGPFFIPQPGAAASAEEVKAKEPPAELLEELKRRLRSGELDDTEVHLALDENLGSHPMLSIFGGQGAEALEDQMRELFSNMPGMRGRKQQRRLKVKDALGALKQEEAGKLIDEEQVKREAVRRVEETGIVFIDELDKVTRREGMQGADVSREGVQRDLLPIVEGSTVNTKYGPVKTDHILFIAAGAFHYAKVSDLIPELQGRFPVRVELESLGSAEFKRILTEPSNALTRQYTALLKTEGIDLEFSDEAIDSLASYAERANERLENIGARRLHTVMEALLEDLSFRAPELGPHRVIIDAQMVAARLEPLLGRDDLARYVL